MEGQNPLGAGARKWAVAMIGPPPKYGDWDPSDAAAWEAEVARADGAHLAVELRRRRMKDPFLKEEGAWKYRGEKPEYEKALAVSGRLRSWRLSRLRRIPRVLMKRARRSKAIWRA